uniref:Zinc finger PHD-type domain-containing protein n=1 Tax=Plectus sambesii TaxID=2011161 RepID=A0A914UVD9_9BILA
MKTEPSQAPESPQFDFNYRNEVERLLKEYKVDWQKTMRGDLILTNYKADWRKMVCVEINAIKSLPVPVMDDPNGAVGEIPVEFFLIRDMMCPWESECCWKHDELNAGLTLDANPQKEVAQLNKDIKKSEKCIATRKQLRSGRNKEKRCTLRLIWPEIFAQIPPKPCEGILCLNVSSRSVSKRSNDLLSCSICRRKLHFACEGVVIESEIIAASKGAHECLCCKSANGLQYIVGVAAMKAKKAQKALDEQLEKQSEIQCRLALMKDIGINKNGPYSKRIAQALEELGVRALECKLITRAPLWATTCTKCCKLMAHLA